MSIGLEFIKNSYSFQHPFLSSLRNNAIGALHQMEFLKKGFDYLADGKLYHPQLYEWEND